MYKIDELHLKIQFIMDEFEKMAIAQLKVIIASEPCAVGKCHTNPRYEYAKRLWNGEGIVQDKRHFFISKKLQISDMKEPNIKLDVVITKEMVFHKILKKL